MFKDPIESLKALKLMCLESMEVIDDVLVIIMTQDDTASYHLMGELIIIYQSIDRGLYYFTYTDEDDVHRVLIRRK